MNVNNEHISPEYFQRLSDDYGQSIANVIQHEWRQAPLPAQSGQTIDYIFFENDEQTVERPVLFSYGFTGGIVANAPFGAAMAARDFEIIIPNQNRYKLLRNEQGRRDPTLNQALNLVAIIEQEELQDVPLNVVTHSYGSLVFDALAKYAAQNGWRCFEGSKVAMLAPAGVIENEHTLAFLKRYAELMTAGKHLSKFDDSYWSFEQEMFKAGQDFVMANPLRAVLECRDIIKKRVDFPALFQMGIGKVALLPFAEDRLYSDTALNSSYAARLADGVFIMNPVSLESTLQITNDLRAEPIRSFRGADHSDQQFNPERVANSVEQFLQS